MVWIHYIVDLNLGLNDLKVYLQNYVTWFKWIEKFKEFSHIDKIKEFLIHSNSTFNGTKYTEVSNRDYKILFQ